MRRQIQLSNLEVFSSTAQVFTSALHDLHFVIRFLHQTQILFGPPFI